MQKKRMKFNDDNSVRPFPLIFPDISAMDGRREEIKFAEEQIPFPKNFMYLERERVR